MRFVYDEGHNQTWTIDPNLAVALSRRTNEAPRYYSYAHVADLIRERFGSPTERLTAAPITGQELAGASVLLLNHCCDARHKHAGVGGEAAFSPDEISAIAEAVNAGMGLLVLGEFEIDSWGTNVNDLLAWFGLRFNNDVATVESAVLRGVDRLAVFEAAAVREHPAARGVAKVSYCSGCTLALLDERAQPVVLDDSGSVLIAAAEVGRGRVVAVGDSDLFAEPFLSYNDNETLLVGVLEWLSGGTARAKAKAPAKPARITAHDWVARGLDREAGPAPGTILELSDDERGELEAWVERVGIDPLVDFEAFNLEAKLLFHDMPRRARRALLEFVRDGNVDGVLMIRNFPLDRGLPPTPSRPGEPGRKDSRASELWLCCVAAALGEPVGYQQEKKGRIFQDVFPTRENADKLSSESSSILLDFHTEIAFHPFMPDYILLYGLRQDPDREARTIFSSVRRFFHLLTPGDRDTLFSNLYRTGVDYSFGNVEEKKGVGPLVSILYGDRLDPFLRYDLDLMAGQTPAARHALQVVRELVNQVQRDVVLEPGSLLVLDNRRCVHARSHFRAYYDGRDRWLQRMSVVRDLQASLRDRASGSRVIATDFSEYLTPIEASVLAADGA